MRLLDTNGKTVAVGVVRTVDYLDSANGSVDFVENSDTTQVQFGIEWDRDFDETTATSIVHDYLAADRSTAVSNTVALSTVTATYEAATDPVLAAFRFEVDLRSVEVGYAGYDQTAASSMVGRKIAIIDANGNVTGRGVVAGVSETGLGLVMKSGTVGAGDTIRVLSRTV